MEMAVSVSSQLRHRLLTFLLHSSLQLDLPPVIKYTSLSLFIDRFFPCLNSQNCSTKSWLLAPLRESNLQLFALISIWISSKIHDTSPLSLQSLKSLGDETISDQHFITRDYVEAELTFLKVLRFDIGALDITFIFLEDLLIRFKEIAKVGDLINFDTCKDIMDLLYETEDMSLLYQSARYLAASVMVTSYFISVPKQIDFPLLPWVKLVTSYREEDIAETVRAILEHVLKPRIEAR